MDSNSWVRIAIFAVILISFLRRVLKVKARSGVPSAPARSGLPSSMQAKFPSSLQSKFPATITPTMARPSGRKNDFRDVPPPPENPDLG